eukprot:5330152-Lingulodinium_polyedra.AAC.1
MAGMGPTTNTPSRSLTLQWLACLEHRPTNNGRSRTSENTWHGFKIFCGKNRCATRLGRTRMQKLARDSSKAKT